MTVAIVRALIPDQEQYDRAEMAADGLSVEFLLPNAPVVGGTVVVYVNGAVQTVTTHYTVQNDVGLVTFVSAPAAAAVVAVSYRWTLLADATISVYLTLQGSDSRLAAADALDAIASNEALVQKKVRSLDTSTDGPAVADALRKHAAQLRKQVADALLLVDGAAAFDWAEMVVDQFSEREQLEADLLRNA